MRIVNNLGNKSFFVLFFPDPDFSFYDFVEMCLKAGIPIAKIDSMRPFLEKYDYPLTSIAHLSETIPLVLEKEMEILEFSVIFDGSSWFGEVLAIVL